MSDTKAYSIGVDYGTNSVRALVVDTATGHELAVSVFAYPSGEAGILLDASDPTLARQNPQDYIDGFVASVSEAVKLAGDDPAFSAERVVGIGVDTTGSSPLPVDRAGRPLALHPEFKDDLAAQCWLWKDHTSHAEAAEITALAQEREEPYLALCGGTYSSEWYWSKILHCERTSPEVAQAAYAWVECADFVPGYLTGNTDPHTMARSVCAAGHKAMYNARWGGLPSSAFLDALSPGLSRFRDRYAASAQPSSESAGTLRAEIAERVGLPAGIPVATGAFDAHHGAVGSGVAPGTIVKIIGTSTCDIMTSPLDQQIADIPGVCGIVPESVLPGALGIEAGQSAVGDLFNWYVQNLGRDGHDALTERAAVLKPGESGLLALDWNNGNRTVLVDPRLSGLLVGQSLHTTAAEIYRALIEATAFGSRAIIQRIRDYGVGIESVTMCGGIAEKNPMAMQIYADILNLPIRIARSGQACALGAAVFGAVVGGAHRDTGAAVAAMTGTKDVLYSPDRDAVPVYEELFGLYMTLHDSFGGVDRSADLGGLMKRLMAIRDRARRSDRA
ncbi:ribulokinase [Mucisphaera calidilacus]|uniref:Ribulokinase n=1 Tax=Mucisphaera calidilacus TaxID=2527982 RepID=A0A518BX17_9BACT|nr:ribulokinase [Mucisphaera calidilacus]QDU71484.1 Ribulokinase [Mucisphaera calidilacus]